VTSPTFVVGVIYDGATNRLAHLDLYRLSGLAGEDPGLLDPYFGADVITFVEWPEHAGAQPLTGRAEPAALVRLEHLGRDARRVDVLR
jgi:tRNA threonylcarbamoyladenosine biosynthesis protein TsaE